MYSYSDQLAVVRKIRIRDGQSIRLNCPFCSGRNTFGITRKGESLVWHCYRASCDVRGALGGDNSISGIKVALEGSEAPRTILQPLPTMTSVDYQPEAIKWLKSVHALQAYRKGLVDIRYAPSHDRIMFMLPNKLGATGRARKGVKPKWLKFGDTTSLFTCGSGTTAVLVEDAPSACAVGIIPEYTGASLLGTSLTHEKKLELLRFKKVLVCLDPDAAAKGLLFTKAIGGLVDSSLRLIKDDLKYFNTKQIKEMLE